MRLIRLVRLVKLYRHFESNKDQKNSSEAKKVVDDEKDVEESRVGQKLSGEHDCVQLEAYLRRTAYLFIVLQKLLTDIGE